MNFIDGVFFFYIFVGLYMTSLLLSILLLNFRKFFQYPAGKLEPVSIIVPCYNGGKNIGETIESLLSMDYPKDMLEIIVVDDKSTDDSVKIVQRYAKKYKNVRLIINKRNSGGAAEPTNIGIMAAKYNYVAVTDDDSTPDRDALRKMIGFLQQDKKVAAVTCQVLVKESKTFMQKLQQLEYIMIVFSRKLLDFIDSVYVTPGPFALYKKKALIEVGLFDTKNMTQDIEIVWRLLSRGYIARMCAAARVYSHAPEGFRAWWRQRIRWNIGGTQALLKYRKTVFRNGMLGIFIIPFFCFSLFLGLFGLGLFCYLMFNRFVISYLTMKYSIYTDAALFVFQDFSFMPSVLNFFGILLFVIGLIYTLWAINFIGKNEIGKRNVFNVLFYLIVYLSVYPVVIVASLYKMARGNYKW